MTSRERVLAALNHREPDRVPIDFGGHRSSGIAAIAYRKLRKALGLPERPIRVYDPIQQLAIIDDDVLDRFHVDTIELGRGFALEDEHWADWTLPDGTPCQMPRLGRARAAGRAAGCCGPPAAGSSAACPTGRSTSSSAYWPFLEHDDLDRLPEALAENMWVRRAQPARPAGRRAPTATQRAGRRAPQAARSGPIGRSSACSAATCWRSASSSTASTTSSCSWPAIRERAHEFLDRLVEIHLANLERFLGAVGPYIDIIVFGDDLGMQNGPQMSPAMYREFFKPRHARMWRRAKELADVKVMLHCCGGVRPLLPDLIEAGLDAINPVQITCAGMDAGRPEADFGDRLTFWGGGCDTRFVLSHGTPDEVRRHVREQVAILKPGGGFVFQQVHNILADVPPENIIAMFDAACGKDEG